jgi:hypothetical protein
MLVKRLKTESFKAKEKTVKENCNYMNGRRNVGC